MRGTNRKLETTATSPKPESKAPTGAFSFTGNTTTALTQGASFAGGRPSARSRSASQERRPSGGVAVYPRSPAPVPEVGRARRARPSSRLTRRAVTSNPFPRGRPDRRSLSSVLPPGSLVARAKGHATPKPDPHRSSGASGPPLRRKAEAIKTPCNFLSTIHYLRCQI